jgi:hypothetical protein
MELQVFLDPMHLLLMSLGTWKSLVMTLPNDIILF